MNWIKKLFNKEEEKEVLSLETRIHVKTFADGRVEYHPQFKRSGIDMKWQNIMCVKPRQMEMNEEEWAKWNIDAMLEAEKRNKIVSEEYVKYP